MSSCTCSAVAGGFHSIRVRVEDAALVRNPGVAMGGITAAALTLASSGIGRGGVDALALPRGIGLGGDGCRTPSSEAAVGRGGGGGIAFVAIRL